MYLLAILRHNASSTLRAWVFAACISRRHWEYHTLSRRGWEYDALRVRWEYHTLSTGAESAESIILSVPPDESCMILSALFGLVITLTAVATKKTTISDSDDCQLIGLPPKMAEFCHTLNILLVGHWRRRALRRLYFNSTWLVGQSVSWSVSWSVGNKGCRALGGFLQKEHLLYERLCMPLEVCSQRTLLRNKSKGTIPPCTRFAFGQEISANYIVK